MRMLLIAEIVNLNRKNWIWDLDLDLFEYGKAGGFGEFFKEFNGMGCGRNWKSGKWRN